MTVVKIVELIGSSPKDWEDAAKNALTEAAKTIKNIKSVYVKRCTAKVENSKNCFHVSKMGGFVVYKSN